ncbi:PTS sugar transporter subunit IIB [Lachnospiraceae bacterium 54-53]
MGDKMNKVYLFCSSGMSTSLLAQEMQKVADRHQLPMLVKAFPIGELDTIVGSEKIACLWLGPQVKYMLADTIEKYKDQMPIGAVPAADYGMMNGENVVKATIRMMKEYKKSREGR